MKKARVLIVLLLAALLVAMPAAANTYGVFNGADALMLGTKTTVQEEVGGAAAENMAAFAVEPSTVQALSINTTMALAGSVTDAAHCYGHIFGLFGSYKPTPGAGGDGLARHF